MRGTKEEDFEDEVVAALLDDSVGYELSHSANFSREHYLDTVELLKFVQDTQPESWALLSERHGSEEAAAARFVQRVAEEVDRRGPLDVLRRNVTDQQVDFTLATFRPATSMNARLTRLYASNRLTVTRQLRYSNRHTNELDLCLFVNGIPIATVELKNRLTRQSVQDAIKQYREERDGNEAIFRRTCVHFAVDQYLVYYSTRLDGKNTEFLPFNRGGSDGAAGNPPEQAEGQYRTSYLWKDVWQRDSWLDLLNRFAYEDTVVPRGQKRARIFPRYHQWDAVRELRTHAKENGAGTRYLVQHSAGSGKTRTISWLAHQLASLHSTDDQRIFDKVIVLTDRTVLDAQLRRSIEALERVRGTVLSIAGRGSSKSSQLATALRSKAKIIVSTIQTFPHLLSQLGETGDLAATGWAILIDEAHSSTSGDAMTALKRAVGAEAAAAAAARASAAGTGLDGELLIAETLASRAPQSNVSIFAFTATPKGKTLEAFGWKDSSGEYLPAHLYSMRQAIEEGFILDVLQNYVTYDTYWRLSVTEDGASREVDVTSAGKELKRLVVRHPTVIAQKAAIIVEHVREHTVKQLDGMAKAMVVCDSRLSAANYKRAIDTYISERRYDGIRALVAFSDSVELDGEQVSESNLNGFPDSETEARFKGLDPFPQGMYQVLVVAEKFQVGFDEPLLHTMFVDKVLSGVAAVQTISRLNRASPGKTTTFVLDFVNSYEAILAEFRKWYVETTATPTDLNTLADLNRRVYDFGFFTEEAVHDIAVALNSLPSSGDGLGEFYRRYDPILALLDQADEDELEDFRSALSSYLKVYSFLSQVSKTMGVPQEALYLFGRGLLHLMPSAEFGGVQLGDDVVLSHLRLEATGTNTGSLDPAQDVDPLEAFPGRGQGGKAEKKIDQLGNLIARINDLHGLDLDEGHRLAVEQIQESINEDEGVRETAAVNTFSDFMLEFPDMFYSALAATEKSNKDLYRVLSSDDTLAAEAMEIIARQIWRKARSDRSD